MPKKDHLSGLADLGQEAGSSQLQSFITVHRHTMVWVPSLPLNPRLSVTPVLALHPSFPLSSVDHRGDLCTQSPFPHWAMSLALASVPILPRIKIPVTGISCPSTSHWWPPPASLKGAKAPWEGLGVQVQELQLLVPMLGGQGQSRRQAWLLWPRQSMEEGRVARRPGRHGGPETGRNLGEGTPSPSHCPPLHSLPSLGSQFSP